MQTCQLLEPVVLALPAIVPDAMAVVDDERMFFAWAFSLMIQSASVVDSWTAIVAVSATM